MSKWQSVPLGEICEITGGNSAPQGTEPYDGGTIPFVRMRDLGRFHFTSNLDRTDDKLTEAAIQKYRMKIFEPGCLLFPRSGSVFLNHRAILGTRACIVSHIGVMQNFKSAINVRFLYYFLQTFDMTRLSKKTTGVDSIAFSDVARIKISLPSLPEQERIVSLLDEAEQLRKLRNQASTRMKKFVPALFHEMFGDPETNESNWASYRIGDLLSSSPNYGSMIPVKNNSGEWLNLRVANIQNGMLDLTDIKYIDLPKEFILRHSVQDGDLLLARAIGSREHLGKCIVVYPGKRKWAFDSHLMRVRPNQDKILPIFLQVFLTSSSGRNIFLKNTRQSAVQFNINTKEFSSIQIPLPPLAIQHEFARRVQEAQEIQAQQAQSAERIEALYQSMLSRAFAGEL